jgi:hypothetical protein
MHDQSLTTAHTRRTRRKPRRPRPPRPQRRSLPPVDGTSRWERRRRLNWRRPRRDDREGTAGCPARAARWWSVLLQGVAGCFRGRTRRPDDLETLLAHIRATHAGVREDLRALREDVRAPIRALDEDTQS